MLKFPMPNDVLQDKVVVASCWYRDLSEADRQYIDDDGPDQIALVLLLNKLSPHFTIAHINLENYEIIADATYYNIVEAVENYQNWGGDI